MEKPFIKELKDAFDHEMKILLRAIDEFPWEKEDAYALWLAQSYFMVRHTTRFASFTASRIKFEDEALHKSLLQHLRDETGHEMLASNDLQNLGWTLKETPELMPTKLMIQCQYYWIGESPYSHYGFIWVLESLAGAKGPELVKRIEKAHKKKCYSFIGVHSELDVDHSAAIFDQIKKFRPADVPLVKESMLQTFYLYTQMLHQIAASAKTKSKAA